MNAEYLLDAIGQMDDSLVQEAEQYCRPKTKRNYGTWLGWAASFAVVLVLGYGMTHFRLDGGSSMAPGTFSGGGNMPVSSAPNTPTEPSGEAGEPLGGNASASYIAENENANNAMSTDSDPSSPIDVPGEGESFNDVVAYFGMEEGQCPAIMVDGVLYWYTSETAVVRPDGLDIRYSTSYTDGEPEENGQINFPKEGVRYVILEEGRVGLNWNGSYEWKIFTPNLPEKP